MGGEAGQKNVQLAQAGGYNPYFGLADFERYITNPRINNLVSYSIGTPTDTPHPFHNAGMLFKHFEKISPDPCSASFGKFRRQQVPIFFKVLI